MKVFQILALASGTAFSGPNQNAVLSVDLLPGSTTPDSTLSMSKDNGAFWVAVRINQAVGLDSYGFELGFDTTRLSLLQTAPSSPSDGLLNFLESLGGTPLGFIARPSQWDSTHISIAHSLIGSDSAQSPDGSGILALFRFQPRGIAGNVTFTLGTAQLLDWKLQSDTAMSVRGATLTLTATVPLSHNGYFLRSSRESWAATLMTGPRDLLGRNRNGGPCRIIFVSFSPPSY